jgi:CheY-like chemotaxis protein
MPIEKIMVLEDDLILRKNLEAQLRQRRYEVSVAATLGEAQDLLGRDTFDLIFLDVRLPDGEGTDLLRELQTRPQRPMVVITTGFGSVESAVDLHEGRRVRLPAQAVFVSRSMSRSRRRKSSPSSSRSTASSRRMTGTRAGTNCSWRSAAMEASAPAHPQSRPHPSHRLDPGRKRHRQRTRRPRHLSRKPAQQRPVHPRQLRRRPGKPDRERVLRPRKRRVHRRGEQTGRPL